MATSRSWHTQETTWWWTPNSQLDECNKRRKKLYCFYQITRKSKIIEFKRKDNTLYNFFRTQERRNIKYFTNYVSNWAEVRHFYNFSILNFAQERKVKSKVICQMEKGEDISRNNNESKILNLYPFFEMKIKIIDLISLVEDLNKVLENLNNVEKLNQIFFRVHLRIFWKNKKFFPRNRTFCVWVQGNMDFAVRIDCALLIN